MRRPSHISCPRSKNLLRSLRTSDLTESIRKTVIIRRPAAQVMEISSRRRRYGECNVFAVVPVQRADVLMLMVLRGPASLYCLEATPGALVVKRSTDRKRPRSEQRGTAAGETRPSDRRGGFALAAVARRSALESILKQRVVRYLPTLFADTPFSAPARRTRIGVANLSLPRMAGQKYTL